MSSHAEWLRIDEAALTRLAGILARCVGEGGIIFLQGQLGAGKTTFARAMLGALGVGERIKSPTYSLIESYRVVELGIHHLDLYRIADVEELEWLGLPDLLEGRSLLLVEWPERGAGALPVPDLTLSLEHAGEHRDLAAIAASPRGIEWIGLLETLGTSKP